jgi:hypothetical protein
MTEYPYSVYTWLILKILSHNPKDAGTRKFVISPPLWTLPPRHEKWGFRGWLYISISLRLWQSMSNCPYVHFSFEHAFSIKNLLPFPLCPAKLIGDYFDNRQCAPNESISLIMGQYWGTKVINIHRHGQRLGTEHLPPSWPPCYHFLLPFIVFCDKNWGRSGSKSTSNMPFLYEKSISVFRLWKQNE